MCYSRRTGRRTAPGAIRGRFGDLYPAHVAPLAPYALRGVPWGQGEGGTAVAGVDQVAVAGALIKGWRKQGRQEVAVLSVQNPSAGGPGYDPTDPITARAGRFTPLPAAVPTDVGPYRALPSKCGVSIRGRTR